MRKSGVDDLGITFSPSLSYYLVTSKQKGYGLIHTRFLLKCLLIICLGYLTLMVPKIKDF